ncbi:hypothetical protein VHUM_01834 [Vanrija humicola]|uniref:BHLH domain-containing protein n=1 Tax=Vanrija humicola TaxID=5417 RepID=A0A7D8Z702_VANHU|nr:hypothetical protein VHUM_01834 [Vanrija humicola]
MSREQLRKANHSLIERRRREKINAALSDLREMVPGLGGEGAGGKGGEFKLEVLERTVEHMRELKAQVEDMQTRLVGLSSAPTAHKKRRPSDDDVDMDDHDDSPPRRPAHTPIQPHSGSYQTRKPAASSTPPSPSVTPPLHHTTVLSSPDPNETEPEFDLPPPLAMASKRVSQDDTSSSARTASPHPPSIASLLASSAQSQRSSTAGSTQRSSAGPNPNIYLPFPTPSPTSPFLTYHPSSASTASSATGPPEPSPFMAPLQNISLFGGALDSSASPLVMPPPSSANGRDMAPEEAANLLLAISSPDTLHPTRTGTTPLMSAVSGRSRALESEDFTLDGGVASVTHARTKIKVEHGQKYRPQGKTARDILRM